MTSRNSNDDKLMFDWDEALYKRIAAASGSKQAVRDVSLGRFLMHHEPEEMITIHFGEKAYGIAKVYRKGLHIYGIATDEDYKNNGWGGQSCGCLK